MPAPRAPARSEAPDSIATAAARAAQVEEDEEDIVVVDDDDAVVEVSSSAPAPATSTPSIPPDIAREAQIARLLTECDVFLRYGLKPKVIDQLQRILAIDAHHVEARDRLAKTLADVGRHDDALRELRTLVEQVLDSNPTMAVGLLQRIIALDPSDEEARGQL